MSVQLVRFTTSPHAVPEVERGIERLFAAVTETAPPGLAYNAFRVGEDFVLVLELDDGVENPLPSIPEAAAFRGRLADWAGAPVPPQPAQRLGRYP